MIVVLVTCKDAAEAERIADALVGEKLAACVNVVPAVSSIFRWEGKPERAAEALMIVKTREERFEALEKRIRALHSYDVPEVIAMPVTQASGPYAAWVREETS